jgi:hypothetical protein
MRRLPTLNGDKPGQPSLKRDTRGVRRRAPGGRRHGDRLRPPSGLAGPSGRATQRLPDPPSRHAGVTRQGASRKLEARMLMG